MDIGVVGSRKCAPHWEDRLRATLDWCKELWPDFVLVSGHCPGGGPDMWAEKWADDNKQAKKIFPIPAGASADFRKRAMARNTEIVRASRIVIALWDWDSGGTANSVAKAVYLNRDLILVANDSDFGVIFDRLQKLAIKHEPCF